MAALAQLDPNPVTHTQKLPSFAAQRTRRQLQLDYPKGFMRKGVIIWTVINNFTFDGSTTDPVLKAVRDALIAFMAATAQAQAEATKEAQKAGILHAKGDRTKYRGKKPSFDQATLEKVQRLLELGSQSISSIARDCSLSRQTVLRIRDDPGNARKALNRWTASN